ncbi:hypothetical protein BDV93DRAFT_559982 [Ceratobasidium sp. AG-I]|nr:hypothetical protein BDV93DRAFT_559982 [Ceratobasidium sp. AG-I]
MGRAGLFAPPTAAEWKDDAVSAPPPGHPGPTCPGASIGLDTSKILRRLHTDSSPSAAPVLPSCAQSTILDKEYQNHRKLSVSAAVLPKVLRYKIDVGRIAAPSPNSAMFNGHGTWDCATYGNSSTCFTQTPLEIQVVPNKKYRFPMFWYYIDGHTLNVTEADDTGIYSEANSALHRLKLHNGQHYSVIVNTSVRSVGDAYWMRAETNTGCLTTLPDDFANTTFAIIRYVDEVRSATTTTNEPTTSDWTDV